MTSMGVNLEDVWQQGSLISAQPAPTKRSKYTIPVPVEHFEGQGPSQRPPQQQPQYFRPDEPIPISEQPLREVQPGPTTNSEIPQLREQLNLHIDAVNTCQKDMQYMKTLVMQLKRELNDARVQLQVHQKTEKRKRTIKMLWMGFIGLILLAVAFGVIHMTKKLNLLISQPML